MTKSYMAQASIGVLMLGAALGSASAVESLGPNEVIAAVLWTTSGDAAFEDTDDTGLKDVLQPNPSDDVFHTISGRTLSLLILDVVNPGYRTIAVDDIDPFWRTEFNFESISFDESAIPAEGTSASIPYLGQYGTDFTFGTAFSSSTGIIEGFAFPVTFGSPDVVDFNPNIEIAGRSAAIDCCQATDIRGITYGTPSTEGLWLDTDGDSIADSNVDALLAGNGLPAGDMSLTVTNMSFNCSMLPHLRNECISARGQVMTTTFAIPLQFVPPAPDQCDLNEDERFGVADIRMFVLGCRSGTATWECDLDGSGQFSVSDGIRFVLGCGLKPDTQANLDEASALLRRATGLSR
ncbi:MAG: hypothetical protein KFB96_19465 [Thiocapsa sp.]|uniref:hypothetical protein n=1 Tax=Thiocapsa sp. TaxID=2024551 RepID=UPI001BCAC933|nr:hypothetical protein [Thiocapsa sp.]QVL47830.1 MAG: hypothetical protein KFB96_19465 [Thiocapsa sp.]